jgi:hypothetical protein
MYKIEITADTLAELAGKAASLAAKLNTGMDGIWWQKTDAPQKLKKQLDAQLGQEVAEAAPAPLPASPVEETASSSAEEKVSSGPTETTPPAGELNFDIDVAPHVLQVVKEKGKPVAQEILSQFGVEKASLLDPTLWPELVDQLKAAL